MMRCLIAATLLLTACSTAYGEKLWACDGLKNSKHNSSTGPFLMRGNTNFYKWRGEYRDFDLKKIG